MKNPSVIYHLITLAVAICQSASLKASGYYEDYLPLQLAGKSRVLPQRTIADSFGGDWKQEVLDGVTADIKEGIVTLSGKDKSGQAWTIEETESRGLGGSCYVADVDKNGTDDIIFWFATGSCGLPFSVVNIYFFDKNGLPHKEEIVSRFSPVVSNKSKQGGLSDLIIFHHDRGSCSHLLVQDLAYGNLSGKDHSYIRWSLLKAENCKLTEVNSLAGITLPCYVWFTKKPNHKISSHRVVLEKTWLRSKAN